MEPRNYAQELATFYLYGEPAPAKPSDADLFEQVIAATEKRQAEPKPVLPKYFPEEAQSGKFGRTMAEFVEAMQKAQQTSAANPWNTPISLPQQARPRAKRLCPVCGDPNCGFSRA